MTSESSESVTGYRPLRQEIKDLPNIITLIRIGFVPPVLLCVDNYSPGMSAMACVLFLIAAVSDVLDGYLARRLGMVTILGKFLDPLVDKLIILSTLIIMASADRVPMWLVIVLLTRELAITGLRAVASQQGFVIAAGRGGKIKTAFQLVGIAFLLVHFEYPILFFEQPLNYHEVGLYLLYISLIMSVLSALEYFKFFAEAAAHKGREVAKQEQERARIEERAARRRDKLRALAKARRRSRRAAVAARLSNRRSAQVTEEESP